MRNRKHEPVDLRDLSSLRKAWPGNLEASRIALSSSRVHPVTVQLEKTSFTSSGGSMADFWRSKGIEEHINPDPKDYIEYRRGRRRSGSMNGKFERFVVKVERHAREPGDLSNIGLVIWCSSCNSNDAAKEKCLTFWG